MLLQCVCQISLEVFPSIVACAMGTNLHIEAISGKIAAALWVFVGKEVLASHKRCLLIETFQVGVVMLDFAYVPEMNELTYSQVLDNAFDVIFVFLPFLSFGHLLSSKVEWLI